MTQHLGGAGGGGSPTIVKDNVRSQDSVEFILGICEGPIAGLIDGPKSFYLGDTPLQSEDGDYNFEAFELHAYHGEAEPTRVSPSFGGTASNIQVGVECARFVPITRTTPSSLRGSIDRLEVRIAFNQLLRTNDDGDQLEAEAAFTIKYKKTTETAWRSFTGASQSKMDIQIARTATTNGLSTVLNSLDEDASLRGNIKKLINDDDVTSITLAGATNGSRTVGSITYNRRVVTTYGTFWFNTSTGNYDFVIDETAASNISGENGVTETFSATAFYTTDTIFGQTQISYAVSFKVNIKPIGKITVKAKTGSTYVKEYVRPLPVADRNYDGDWEIQVERLTTQSDEDLFVRFSWESFQCVSTNSDLKFENLAVIRGLGAGSSQFSSLPTFSGIFAGKLIKVPNNYDPVTRVYTGTWDGTFKLAFSDNPAWCLYDVVMDTRYGLKYHIPNIQADRFSFYEAAQWCDVLVPRNGATGYQPRYTYNDMIDQPRNAIELCQYIASIFGGIITTDMNLTVKLRLDKPGSVVQIFGPENVTIDGFQYQIADVNTRVNDMTVTFINPELDWNQDVRRLTMDDKIERNGRIPQDFVAVGCIDPYEAERRAWLRMLSANTEITTVTFSTTRPGVLLELYDIIGIVDPNMNWGLSGRIKSLGRDGVSLGLPTGYGTPSQYTHALSGVQSTRTTALLSTVVPFTTAEGVPALRVTAPIASNHHIAPKQLVAPVTGRKYRMRFKARHNGAFVNNSQNALVMNLRCYDAAGAFVADATSQNATFTSPNTWQSFELVHTFSRSEPIMLPFLWLNSTRFATAGVNIEVSDWEFVDITDEVHLRDPMFLTATGVYTMTLQTSSGPVDVTVQNIGGVSSTKLLVLSGTIPADVPTNAQFALTSTSVGLVKPFRVLSIQEDTETADQYTITAIEMNANKYGDADNLTASGTLRYSFENSTVPKRPRNIEIESGTAHLIKTPDGSIRSRIYVSWEQDPATYSEEVDVYYKRIDRENYSLIRATGKDCYIPNVQDGMTYNIMLRTRNAIGKLSLPTRVFQHTVVGKSAKPTTPTGGTTSQIGSDVRVDWNDIPDLDLDFYEIRIGGSGWDSATRLGTAKSSVFTHANVTGSTVTYRIRSVDTTGNYSNSSLVLTHTVQQPFQPTLALSLIGTDYRAYITPPAGDVLPLKEYVLTQDGVEVFRGSSNSFSARATWLGSKTFSVKAINTAGVESAEATASVTINAPSAPTLVGSFSDSAYTLSWNVPAATLPIERYVIRNKTTGLVIDADLKATTYTMPISWTGTRQFEVWAVDSAGNAGAVATITATVVLPSVINFQSLLRLSQLTLSWAGVRGTLPIKQYRLYLAGTQIAVIDAQNWSQPVDWNGTRVYGIAAEDMNGNLSPVVTVTETVDAPPAPSVTNIIVDKSIRLDWSEPVSELRIREYEIWRDGALVQKVSATTALVPINFAGTKTYQVRAVDEAGNLGAFGSTSLTINAPTALVLDATIVGEQVRLTWNTPTSTLPVQEYILMRGAANTVITRVSANSHSFKADWVGLETFKVQAVDVAGNLSAVFSDTLEIVAPTQPSVRPEVLDNNVLLRWTNGAGTLPVVAAEIRRGTTFATATVLQQVDATFAPFFEFSAGTYTYWVVNIDSAGNYGTPSSVTAIVSQPQDFVLQADFDSAMGGTRTRTHLANGKLYLGVDPNETYEQHFTKVSNSTIQDQISDGYPYWLQPTSVPASYQEVYDYGAVLASSLITITPTLELVFGNASVAVDIETRATTSDPWTTLVTGQTQAFASNFRYVRFTIRLLQDTLDDVCVISRINVKLNSKLKNDSGTGVANASDVGGTVVNFNTAFADVQSISVTPLSTTARYAVYDFVDVPYPTSFKVLIFDQNGNRVSGNFSWSCRGF